MIDIYTSTPCWQQLRRIAPIQLQAMVRRNETAGRLLKALCLLTRYFPEAYEEYDNISIWQARTKWMDIMLKFYKLVDGAFFKVDWRLIELAQKNWTEAKGSAESEKLLTLFLKYIPFLIFGFTMAATFVCPATCFMCESV